MRELTIGQTTRFHTGNRFRLCALHHLCAEVCTEVYSKALQDNAGEGLCTLVRTYTGRRYPNSGMDSVILADMKMWLGEQNVSWGSKMSVTLPYVCSVDGKHMRLALLKLAAEHYSNLSRGKYRNLSRGNYRNTLKVQRPLSAAQIDHLYGMQQLMDNIDSQWLTQFLKRANMPQHLVPFLRKLKRTKLESIDRYV